MNNTDPETTTERPKVTEKQSAFYSVALFIMLIGGIFIVLNIVDYKIKPLHDEIAQLRSEIAQKPTIKVINTRDLAGHFSMSRYDTVTQLEYMDILKILLEKSNIVAVNEDALLFKSQSNNMKINDIADLRAHLQKLKIENPRIVNEEQYKQREQQQRELLERLTGQ